MNYNSLTLTITLTPLFLHSPKPFSFLNKEIPVQSDGYWSHDGLQEYKLCAECECDIQLCDEL